MATPSEKLAESLEVLHKLQNGVGAAAIRARDLTRTHRERLLKNGFLQEVMKGWYIPSRPDDGKGESTALVCLVLAFRRGLSGAPVPQELEPVSGTIVIDPRRERHRSPPTGRTLAQGHQQRDKAAARNVAFRSPGGAASLR
jgi:hypothetical protein